MKVRWGETTEWKSPMTFEDRAQVEAYVDAPGHDGKRWLGRVNGQKDAAGRDVWEWSLSHELAEVSGIAADTRWAGLDDAKKAVEEAVKDQAPSPLPETTASVGAA